jgi:hypothetical protein
MTGVILGSLTGVAATALVLVPLLRRNGDPGKACAEPTGVEMHELESERRRILAALRDLEDDRATGKMGESDYRELRAKLVARGARILERIDAAVPRPGGPVA